MPVKMKKILLQIVFTFVILQLSITVMLINSGCGFYKSEKSEIRTEQKSENSPLLNFCELTKNPENYDGKIVRLKAKLTFGLEGAWFSDANCGIDKAAFVESTDKNLWASIEKLRRQNDGKILLNEIELNVVGKFKNTSFNEGGLITPFRFEVLQIENANL